MRHHESKQDRFAAYARQVIESVFDLQVIRTAEGETPSSKMFAVSLLAYLAQCGFEVTRRPAGKDPAEISDKLTPGYHKALLLVRGGHPKSSEVAAALGGDSADGPEGNVWTLFDQRLKAFLAGRFSVAQSGEVAMEPFKLTELAAGEKVVEMPGLMLRDNGILAVFYDDGVISFSGDAEDMVAFRDMAARVVGVPGSREAA